MLLLYAVLLVQAVNGARILAVQHVPVPSHYILINTIMKELANKGHDVTMLSTYKEKSSIPNFKTILLSGAREKFRDIVLNIFGRTNIIEQNVHQEMFALNLTQEALLHPNLQKLLRSNETFDLVILEHFFNEALRGICYHYDSLCISLSTVYASRWSNKYVGNSGPPSYVPDALVHFSTDMNFVQRLYNTLLYFLYELISQLYFLPIQNDLLQKHFPNAPSVYELMYNSSLILVNSHLSVHFPLPYVPNMIEIGGFHVAIPKTLPKELKKFLDDAKDGAIYFALGSYLNTSLFPKEMETQLYKMFSKLKQKVLWKWDHNVLPENNSNILIKNWFPQNDILAHRNVKLFITHGGLLSNIEAIYHAVPIIGIPILGDQAMNMANVVRLEYGLSVPLLEFTEEKLENALYEVFNNDKYQKNVQKRSNLFHSRPMKPLDTAMFWIEHILQHGSSHLRTASFNLKWYQYYSLDVLAVVLLTFYILLKIFVTLIKNIMSFLKQKRLLHSKKIN